jgi:hypothetical protein
MTFKSRETHTERERERERKIIDTNKSYFLCSGFIALLPLNIQPRIELRRILRRYREWKLRPVKYLFELTELSKKHGAMRTLTGPTGQMKNKTMLCNGILLFRYMHIWS